MIAAASGVAGLFVAGTAAVAADPPAAARQAKALIIGIDGCRPDALQAARTPHLDALVADGVWFDATDIRKPGGTDEADTVSGPGWSNLLTGVWPDKHGVLNNKFSAPQYDRYPHMFSRLKQARPEAVTASFSTWKPIADQIVRDADHCLNVSDEPTDYARWDADVAAACVAHLRAANPDLTIFYQGQVDETGHAHGFHPTVPQYIAAIETVDANIGSVLAAIRERPTSSREDWLVIVCTDHGGLGTNHAKGREEPDVRRTFLIVSGPSAARGTSDEATFQVDVAATALTHLGVTLREDWGLDGRPVGLARQP